MGQRRGRGLCAACKFAQLRCGASSGVHSSGENFALTQHGGLKAAATMACRFASLLFDDFEAEFFDYGIG